MKIKKISWYNCLKNDHVQSPSSLKSVQIQCCINKTTKLRVSSLHSTSVNNKKTKFRIKIDYSTKSSLNDIDFSLDIHGKNASDFSGNEVRDAVGINEIQECLVGSILIKLNNHFELDEDDMKIVEGFDVVQKEMIIKTYLKILEKYSNHISSLCDISLDIENVNNYNFNIYEIIEIYRISLEKCSKVIIILLNNSYEEQHINDIFKVFSNAINEFSNILIILLDNSNEKQHINDILKVFINTISDISKIIINICSKNKPTSNKTKNPFEIITVLNKTHIRYSEAIDYISNNDIL
jgi:hypothetical protein